MPSDVVPIRQGGDIIEQVITKGDLARLTPQERVTYYNRVCDSLGLNPFTRPLEFLTLSGKMVLYARRDAADQLRKINGISLEVVSQKIDGDLLTVHVRARDKAGRTDEDFGVVSIAGLRGEARANATLKAVTKAKRRVTLSIAGLGFLDETEVDDIPARERMEAPADTTADLDQFAAVTGDAEPPPERDILAEARDAAEHGRAAFEAFWKSLSKPERDSIRQHMDEFRTTALQADDPLGLPPLPAAEPVTEAEQPVAARDVFAELDRDAKAAAEEGSAELTKWWKTLRRGDADLIRAFRPEYEQLAKEADAQHGLAL